MQELVEKYITDNGVVFELRAYNEDGDTLITYTGESFDEVSGFSFMGDQAFLKLVQESEEGRDDDIIDAAVNNELDTRNY